MGNTLTIWSGNLTEKKVSDICLSTGRQY